MGTTAGMGSVRRRSESDSGATGLWKYGEWQHRPLKRRLLFSVLTLAFLPAADADVLVAPHCSHSDRTSPLARRLRHSYPRSATTARTPVRSAEWAHARKTQLVTYRHDCISDGIWRLALATVHRRLAVTDSFEVVPYFIAKRSDFCSSASPFFEFERHYRPSRFPSSTTTQY